MPRTKPDSFMRTALALAARGQGLVEPNPMVGCVIAREGQIVGRGYHRKYGQAHAEINALREAAGKARSATVFTTLEPCCHFGKTPPCVDALIAANVARVVAAMKDPNPVVAGRGIKKLRAAGIKVDVGLLESEARAMNAPFIKLMKRKQPYVILKWAQSIDGRFATRTGDSKWISSPESRRRVHELRARMDAIIVGVSTVLADDPELTTRLAVPRRIATRVILDSKLRTPLTSKLVRTARKTPTILFTTERSRSHSRCKRYLRAGCEVISVRSSHQGLSLEDVLDELGGRQMTNVLVEGGGRVLGSFIQEQLADEAMVFIAPLLIGGGALVKPVFEGPTRIKDALRPQVLCLDRIGPDLCYNLRF